LRGGGDYFGKDYTKIYSLRDEKGLSHVTVELYDSEEHGEWVVWQIKGKQNEAPVDRYKPYIIKFIEDENLTVAEDGENIGMESSWDEKQGMDIYYWPGDGEITSINNAKLDKIRERIHDNTIDGDVRISSLGLNEIPEWFNGLTINGNFSAALNKLTSLKNSPSVINGDFYVYSNKLETLDGAPSRVSGIFHALNNPMLKSLKGIGEVKGQVYSDL